MELSLLLVAGSGYVSSSGWAAPNAVVLDDSVKRTLGSDELAAY